MKGNVTGGIILLVLGAVIIAMGVSEKGKRIFNVLTDGQGSFFGGGSNTPNNNVEGQEGDSFSGHPSDPDYIPPYGQGTETASAGAYVGEKGAVAVG